MLYHWPTGTLSIKNFLENSHVIQTTYSFIAHLWCWQCSYIEVQMKLMLWITSLNMNRILSVCLILSNKYCNCVSYSFFKIEQIEHLICLPAFRFCMAVLQKKRQLNKTCNLLEFLEKNCCCLFYNTIFNELIKKLNKWFITHNVMACSERLHLFHSWMNHRFWTNLFLNHLSPPPAGITL